MDYSDSSASDKEPDDNDYDDDNYEFRQKKRLKRSKDDEMLGIFGSDDDERPALGRNNMRHKAATFSKAGDDYEEEPAAFSRPSLQSASVQTES